MKSEGRHKEAYHCPLPGTFHISYSKIYILPGKIIFTKAATSRQFRAMNMQSGKLRATEASYHCMSPPKVHQMLGADWLGLRKLVLR